MSQTDYKSSTLTDFLKTCATVVIANEPPFICQDKKSLLIGLIWRREKPLQMISREYLCKGSMWDLVSCPDEHSFREEPFLGTLSAPAIARDDVIKIIYKGSKMAIDDRWNLEVTDVYLETRSPNMYIPARTSIGAVFELTCMFTPLELKENSIASLQAQLKVEQEKLAQQKAKVESVQKLLAKTIDELAN